MIAELPQVVTSLLWVLGIIFGGILLVLLIMLPMRIANNRQIARTDIVLILTILGIFLPFCWLAALITACVSKRNSPSQSGTVPT